MHKMEPRIKRHKVGFNVYTNPVHGTTDLSSLLPSSCEHTIYSANQESTVTSTTTIGDLYPELLSIIFSYLDLRSKGRVAQVRSSWRDACYSKSVWKGVEAKLRLKSRNDPLLKSLVSRGIKRIQILSFDRGIKEVTCKVSNLERLVLTGCYNLTDERLMAALSSNMPSLTELGLGMCKQITDIGFFEISRNLPSLEKLDLGGCHRVTDNTLETIRKNFKTIKNLNLRSCRFITDSGIARLCSPNIDSMDISTDSTHQFKYNRNRSSNHHTDKSHHGVRSRYCKDYYHHNNEGNEDTDCLTSLELLDLHDCQTLTDDALRHIGSGLHNLRILNLSFCVGITDMGLKYLSSISQLKEINLRSCNSISDIGLRYLSESDMQLDKLDISFCEKIGDIGLDHISQGLQSLHDLSLNSCSITDRGIIKLSQSLTSLKTLNVGQCNKITDEGIFAIADNCRKLESIDLYGCTRVTTAGYQKILDLPELKYANTDLWQDQQSANEYLNAINSSSKLIANPHAIHGDGKAKSSHHLACYYPDFAFNYYKNLFGCNDNNVIFRNCIVTTTKLCDTCRNVSSMFSHRLDGSPYYILLKIDNRS